MAAPAIRSKSCRTVRVDIRLTLILIRPESVLRAHVLRSSLKPVASLGRPLEVRAGHLNSSFGSWSKSWSKA